MLSFHVRFFLFSQKIKIYYILMHKHTHTLVHTLYVERLNAYIPHSAYEIFHISCQNVRRQRKPFLALLFFYHQAFLLAELVFLILTLAIFIHDFCLINFILLLCFLEQKRFLLATNAAYRRNIE